MSCGCFYQNDDTILITFGKQHVYFWKLFWDPSKQKDGRILRDRKSGNFDVSYLIIAYHVNYHCHLYEITVLIPEMKGVVQGKWQLLFNLQSNCEQTRYPELQHLCTVRTCAMTINVCLPTRCSCDLYFYRCTDAYYYFQSYILTVLFLSGVYIIKRLFLE